jgi:CxxC motif-containing protein (DUF1111 family)
MSISSKAFVFFGALGILSAQVDPGIRGGPAGAGKPFQGLTNGELSFFTVNGTAQFTQVEAVADGLGPRFNLDSCSGCHINPAVGGSSPLRNNPQVVRAPIMAPGNTVPPFLKLNGPIREVRFIKNPDGTPDGGVHGIFTIAGRADKPGGCSITQPNFSDTDNLSFRIPTPVFGGGLIEAITNTTIKNNLANNAEAKEFLGIRGHVNTNGNDGTVTRFGWKAQNKSLLIFAGEAYNVEMGITNENFPNEREEDANCAKNGTPENHSGFNVGSTDPADILSFMGFMKFLDQPAPACTGSGCSTSIQNGHRLFGEIGCVHCHTETLMTGFSSTAALNQKPVHLFSDLAVHHMGQGLADGVTQGSAGPDEFRSAPLWGVGQRAFFLHDGRTSDLLQAILAHGSDGSEAERVVDNFQSMSQSQKQDILNFLRSL